MLTKTRTIIITLIASASFGVAAVAPAVSQAKPIGPGNNRGAACQALYKAYKNDKVELNRAHNANDKALIAWFRGQANTDYGNGFDLGCWWAAIERPAELIGQGSGTTAPVGGATEGAPTTTSPVVLKPVQVTGSLG